MKSNNNYRLFNLNFMLILIQIIDFKIKFFFLFKNNYFKE